MQWFFPGRFYSNKLAVDPFLSYMRYTRMHLLAKLDTGWVVFFWSCWNTSLNIKFQYACCLRSDFSSSLFLKRTGVFFNTLNWGWHFYFRYWIKDSLDMLAVFSKSAAVFHFKSKYSLFSTCDAQISQIACFPTRLLVCEDLSVQP